MNPTTNHQKKKKEEGIQYYLAIYGTQSSDKDKIIEKIDSLFKYKYSIYPEWEWDLFGIFPPQAGKIYGAWRHMDSAAFAFLVDHAFSHQVKNPAFMLHIVGTINEVEIIKRRVLALKNELGNGISTQDILERNKDGNADRKKKKGINAVIIAAIITGICMIIAGISPFLFAKFLKNNNKIDTNVILENKETKIQKKPETINTGD